MKALFSRSGKPISNLKNNALGTASADKTAILNAQTVLIIKLTCHVFGTIDRNSFVAMQNILSLFSSQKKEVARQIVDSMTRKQSLQGILKSYRFDSHGKHNAAYSMLDRLCQIVGHTERFDRSILQEINVIAERFELSGDEVSRLKAKSGLPG